MMKFFQKLGKSLMLPVACLPVCGILMGIGYILAPAAMAGEVQGFTAGSLAYSIGLFLIKAGGALIDNMSWLFAVGVAVGMADDSDGTAGLAGLVSMYMITTLLSPGAVAGITGHEAAPAFGKIINQFVGILVNGDETGCIGSSVQVQFRHPSHVSRLTEVLLVLFREDVPEIGPFQFRFLADTVDTQTDLPVRHGDE